METYPAFRQHPLIRGGHAQTLGGVYFPGDLPAHTAHPHEVMLPDGDRIVLHDDRPVAWRNGGRTALLIHGLAGCHGSPYMRRIAHKLAVRGIRVFRMDLRGCGAGERLARLPYHSGRSEDAGAALRFIACLCPGSPASLIGFSLGGNIALKLMGEVGRQPIGGLDSCLAVCPPIDLMACALRLRRLDNRLYDRHFVRLLMRQIGRRPQLVPDAAMVDFARPPRRLMEFDNMFTAPVSGFGDVENYYRLCSSAQFLPRIQRPTKIIASRDDPLIPSEPFEQSPRSSHVELQMTDGGGHLGFIAGRNSDPDRRWLDWRVVEWVMGRGRSDF
ncbi:MAG: YheT family hydrolase [Pirellulales bacterium]